MKQIKLRYELFSSFNFYMSLTNIPFLLHLQKFQKAPIACQ